MAHKGLGRGLSSLIPPKQNQFSVGAQVAASSPDLQAAAGTQILEIPLGDITPNPQQPRQHFDTKNLEELAESIKVYGLIEPVVVTPNGDKWQLVAGERRFRAHKQLGRKTIKAISRDTSELERLELAMIENIQREDLNPMEKAFGYAQLVDDFGLTQVEAAKKLGVARSSLANSIRLIDLPSEIQIGLAEHKITEGHAKVLLGLDTEEEQMRLFKQMTSGAAMSVKELSDSVAGKSGGSKKRRSVADIELEQVAARMEEKLGTKVSIKRRTGGKKQIVIDTYSDEEFKSIVKKFS